MLIKACAFLLGEYALVMWTFEYPYCNFSFDKFNEAQEAVMPYVDKDVNIVVSFQTAVGKTAIGLSAFGYHLQVEKDSKVVYISPFKSLSEEKHTDFMKDEQFNKYGITLSTGDYFATKEEFEDARIIMLTNESFDAKTRNYQYHNWLKMVTCLVVDEAHLLGQKDRGDVLEAALMRFTMVNPHSRVILLSATMDNETEVAKWIKKLNNKRTIKAKSNYRQNKQEIFFHTFDDRDRYKSYDDKINIAVDLAKENPSGHKMIIFVHSKKIGSDILKRLRKNGITSAFHNASLKPNIRKKIEEAFSTFNSGLDVLVSTSTLSTGVNI